MVRYLMLFQYIGTRYRGLAMQPAQVISHNKLQDSLPIQNILQNALQEISHDDEVRIYTSCRTDKGVHAICNTAHFDLKNIAISQLSGPQLTKLINSKLKNEDIRVLEIQRVHDNFRARFDVLWRSYMYRIINGYNQHELPLFEQNRCWAVKERLDVEKMRDAAKHFIGYKDFAAFRSKNKDIRSLFTWRMITRVNVLETECSDFCFHNKPFTAGGKTVAIEIEGRSFLYRQVRRIAGTLVAVGTGKLSPENIPVMLASKIAHPSYWGIEIGPAGGLYLKDVKYKGEALQVEDTSIVEENGCTEASFTGNVSGKVLKSENRSGDEEASKEVSDRMSELGEDIVENGETQTDNLQIEEDIADDESGDRESDVR